MRVVVEIDYTALPGDYADIDSVVAYCTRCDHETESYGQHDGSVKRCLVLMREECPLGERNFYVEEGEA